MALSSVAKAPPVRTQNVPLAAPDAGMPKVAPLRPSLQVVAPPPIHPKQVLPEPKIVRLSQPAELRQPPKIMAGPGAPAEQAPAIPPPALVKVAPPIDSNVGKKTSARLLIPPIKLEQPAPKPVAVDTPHESIILGPGDSVQEFPARVRPPKIVEKPVASTPPPIEQKLVSELKTAGEPTAAVPTSSPSLVILPPIGPVAQKPVELQPPVVLAEPVSLKEEPKTNVRPPPLPLPKPAEPPALSGLHVVPKMMGSEPTAHPGKHRPPQLPHETGKEVESKPLETKALLKVPAQVPTEPPSGGNPPPALPAKAPPITSPSSKVSGPILLRDSVETSSAPAKVTPPPLDVSAKATGALPTKPEESKPALRPAVLPNKILKTAEAAATSAKIEPEGKASTAPPLEAKDKATLLPPSPAPLEQVPAGVRYERYQAPETGKLHAPVELPAKGTEKSTVVPSARLPLPPTRAERAKKRRIVEMVVFYVLLLLICGGLYFGTIYFTQETRVEGQVIPPTGMPLADEVWIVSDFRQLTSGIAEDLAEDRAPLIQEMHERQDHVLRVQADIAMREERIRLLQAQIQSAKDEQVAVVKDARDQAQQLWDGPGAELDDDYNARRISLQNAIANRAKSLNLNYAPDPTYNAPEVWANAYRLALYEVPKGVDSAKEYAWLSDQMKQWRDFVKSQDDKREQLREQAAQIKTAPAAKLTDLNAKIEELQHRIDSTESEEEPLKPELQQAQGDLAEAQGAETGLDAKYYKQLSALPGSSITKRLSMEPNGRFSWSSLENDSPFAEGEKEHHYWIFARATREDGREYWALGRFSIAKDHTVCLLIEPDSFVSTKAMLRPDLSPDDQAQ